MLIERRTIVVLCIAAVGSGAAWLTHARGPAPALARSVEAERPLLTAGQLPIESITRIRLVRGVDRPMEFTRDAAGEWTQTSPFPHLMDPFSIRQLAVTALEMRVAESIPPDAMGELTPASLSLDPPLARIEFEWADGELRMTLGRLGIAGRAYLQIDGDPDVHVVTQELHDRAIRMDAREWRERRLFRHIGPDADRIMVMDSQGTIVLVRDRKQWVLEKPAATRADREAVEAMLQWLGSVRSEEFLADEPSDLGQFGLDDPAAVVTVDTTVLGESGGGEVTRTPRRQELLIGSAIGGSQDRFAMMRDGATVFRLAATTLITLPVDLADHTASGVNQVDVKQLLITHSNGQRLLLERDIDFDAASIARDDETHVHRWLAPEHGRVEVPRRLVDELLHQLTDLRAMQVEFVDYPKDQEVATVTIFGYDRRPLTTVRVVRHAETGDWGLENGDNVLRVYPKSMQMSLTPADYGIR